MSEVSGYQPDDAKEFVASVTHSSIETTEAEDPAQPEVNTFSSKLAEFITGLKPDDPTMPERLITDQSIIRGKYNLPSPQLPPAEYEHQLMSMAKKLGVLIKPTSDCGKFFENNPSAGGVYFNDSNQIGVDVDKESLGSYHKSLAVLEHELIHAIQTRDTPSMPIELMEYEAYLAGANTSFMAETPEAIGEIFFGYLVGGSVNMYYHNESTRRGEQVLPQWYTTAEQNDTNNNPQQK